MACFACLRDQVHRGANAKFLSALVGTGCGAGGGYSAPSLFLRSRRGEDEPACSPTSHVLEAGDRRGTAGLKPSICASCTWSNLSPTPGVMRTFPKAWNLTSVFYLNGSPASACPENLTICNDESTRRSQHEICVQTMQEGKPGSRKRGSVHNTAKSTYEDSAHDIVGESINHHPKS